MNKELIMMMIEKAQNENPAEYAYYQDLFTNHAVKIRRNKNDFDIISKGFEKAYRITWYENNEPIGHAEFSNAPFDIGQLITEYIWEGWMIEEII